MLRIVLFVLLDLPGTRASVGACRQVESWYALKELCAVGVGGDTLTCKNRLCPAGAGTLEACGRGVCVCLCVCKLVEGVCVCVEACGRDVYASLWKGCVCV